MDSTTNLPVVQAQIVVEGSRRGTVSRDDGSYTLPGVPVGPYTIRVTRIGFAPATRQVNVTAGGTVVADFALGRQTTVLNEVVTVGYGTQKREAITGSVATVNADQADVGVVTNANQLIASRVAGVQMVQNSGEPGAGAQIRIRGGTSITAGNDPLYVVDGVPLQNDNTSPDAAGVGSISGQLSRSPLNSISPDDIESITILKDAAATAIYGSRGANGVVLITTKRGAAGVGTTEYNVYVGAANAMRHLNVATGDQYRAFVQQQVALNQADSTQGLPASALSALGNANTDWERAVERTGLVMNHDLAFSGGSQTTQYRASLNYFDQQGVVLGNGLKRFQGRLNGTHSTFNGRLQMGLNLMASRVDNQFAPIENGGGFLGGLFTNVAIYNPTFPIHNASGGYYEIGTGAQDVRNPVAMAEQLKDNSPENRILGNLTGTIGLMQDLTAQTTLGVDNVSTTRSTYYPRASAVGAAYGGYARQADLGLQNVNFQQLLTYAPHFGASDVEVLGGYEYTKAQNRGFDVQVQNFVSDAFGVDNLAAGGQPFAPPGSYDTESQLVSFFGRANYGFANRFFLTGVMRYDGSSRLAPGHQWELFPAISGSWRLSEEGFMSSQPLHLSSLALRAGWGKQGNQAIQPYQTQLLLRADPGAVYPFGGTAVTGLRAAQVGNPDLKWETTTQTNVGLDYGFLHDRLTGTLEVYQKNTNDLLLSVNVPQPAVVSTQLENIGSVRNRGLEASIDGQLLNAPGRTLSGGLVLTVERNEVTSLGGMPYIITGGVYGQGQSNQYSQRIMVGEPLGTFYGPRFLFVNSDGQQVFACGSGSAGCTNGQTTDPRDEDKVVLGNANPNFTLGLHNNGVWGSFDASWLWRGEFGGKVFNNTALVYQSKANAKQGRNFLAAALDMPDALSEPAKFSSRWLEDRTFVRLQNVSLGYTPPSRYTAGRTTRVYLSGDNLLLFTKYTGLDPEVFTASGTAARGIDYLTYPRARTFTVGASVQF